MSYKTMLFFLFTAIQYCSFASDSTSIYGCWKLHYYHIYTHGKGMDTTFYTAGYIHFNKDHTYAAEKMKMCFMEANDFACPTETGGTWLFTADKVIKITYNERKLICNGNCPDLIDKHGVYVKKLNSDYMVLRTEYFNKKRKHHLIIDAYLVKKVE
jgi:hypothetical protein